MFTLRMRYAWLLQMAYTTGMLYRLAVHSACTVYIDAPSPTTASTGRSGCASFTPSAPGIAQPSAPPRMP